jgi:acyl-CoA synthetase (AMP-forming)/AMP-acid ligase II
MLGYWNNPSATEEAIVDGWYRTGDVATVDETGMITIVDRIKDMIISGGLNVYPAEVERVLAQHDGVRDVCVVGVPDDRWGEVVAAAVVTRAGSGLDGAALGDWCGERLAGYKKPRPATRSPASWPWSTTCPRGRRPRSPSGLCASCSWTGRPTGPPTRRPEPPAGMPVPIR